MKSPRELEYMRITGSILETVFERVRETIRPGIRKNDLVAEIYHSMIAGTAEHGGDYPAIVPLLPTGADATASHLTWNDRPMKRGAGTFLELAGCYRRYHATLCRSVFFGEPPAEFVNAERALMDGLAAGIEAARPGNRAANVAIALNDTLARYGIDRGGARCGYPIGLSYLPDWGERTISSGRPTEPSSNPVRCFTSCPGSGWTTGASRSPRAS